MKKPISLYGVILLAFAFFLYFCGILFGLCRILLFIDNESLRWWNRAVVLYSGFPVYLGFLLILIDIYVFRPKMKSQESLRYDPIENPLCTVVLTAYNDELSIYDSVRDFQQHPNVKRVIVVNNNSTDQTEHIAKQAEAIVVNEPIQGYGACVYRALCEGINYTDTPLTVLCEGDRTFRAYDINKLLAYIFHCDIVTGTRTVEGLQEPNTQLTAFIHYGNTVVGKLLEMKHIGKCTLSDVGTTYKVCRNDALQRILPKLKPRYINLEFNPYFMDKALELGLSIVECPITFHPRVGKSKGGNINSFIAFKLGLRMIRGIMFGWQEEKPH
ncbi:MAG: glycosyltransferase [Desulfobacterales bacterium]|nr:glycosyltransferase [Desulfobacterales bacterium]